MRTTISSYRTAIELFSQYHRSPAQIRSVCMYRLSEGELMKPVRLTFSNHT